MHKIMLFYCEKCLFLKAVDNEFGGIFRLSSMKAFIFKYFSHFYYLFIKIQNPQKPYFLGFFQFPHFLSWFGNFYRKGRVNNTIIYFDAPFYHPIHEHNRYTLSVKNCCHLKCKIPRHTKDTTTYITISNDVLIFYYIKAHHLS